MKRVRQFYHNKENTTANGISGVQAFEGEDLTYASRMKYNQQKQKEWLNQQMEEKRQRQQQEKENDMLYDLQTMQINKLRGAMEYEHNMKRRNNEVNLKQTNLEMNTQLKQTSKQAKINQINEERLKMTETLQMGNPQDFEPVNY